MVSKRIESLEARTTVSNNNSELEYLTSSEVDDIFAEFARNVHYLRVGHQRQLINSERQHIFMATLLLLTGARLSEAIMLQVGQTVQRFGQLANHSIH